MRIHPSDWLISFITKLYPFAKSDISSLHLYAVVTFGSHGFHDKHLSSSLVGWTEYDMIFPHSVASQIILLLGSWKEIWDAIMSQTGNMLWLLESPFLLLEGREKIR